MYLYEGSTNFLFVSANMKEARWNIAKLYKNLCIFVILALIRFINILRTFMTKTAMVFICILLNLNEFVEPGQEHQTVVESRQNSGPFYCVYYVIVRTLNPGGSLLGTGGGRRRGRNIAWLLLLVWFCNNNNKKYLLKAGGRTPGRYSLIVSWSGRAGL